VNAIAEGKVVIKRIMIDALVMFTACCFSLSTLVYVAQGDADRIYRDFYRAAAYSQGQLIQTETELFLQKDLSLQQFAGFNALADPTIAETSSIGSVELLDARGEIVFRDLAAAAASHVALGESAAGKTASGDAVTSIDGEEVKLPLLRKSEIVGSIVLELRLDRIAARVNESFRPIWFLVLICSAAFAGLTFATRKIAWERKRVWTALAFTATFVMVAGLITVILVSLYTEGAGVKGKALLNSLRGRLQEVTDYNISFDQLEGTDKLLADYRKLNPDILSIGLSIGGVAKFNTDPQRIGTPWVPVQDTFQYVADIGGKDSLQPTKIAITMEPDVVFRQIIDSLRNILALFVASALFAYFSMSVARSLQEAREGKDRGEATVSDFGIGLIKPVFFLATFIENLNYAFLPEYVQNVVQATGVPLGFTSFPFIAFYLSFALSLLPAERIASRLGPHKLIWGGLILVAVGLLCLIGQFGFGSIVMARAVSGIGQGFVFIGVQSYVLDVTTVESRTRGASVIVIGFQAGMMSGMAIGSLLVSQLGARGVFALGVVISVVTAIYTISVVPKVAVANIRRGADQPNAWRNILLTLRDPMFLKTIWLIGLPAKAVLTGVILFALPLLLVKRGYRQEDIGQITMAYGGAVMGASAWVSARTSGWRGATGNILVAGAILSGAGLLLISAVGWKWGGFDVNQLLPDAVVILTGAIIVGVGHGFINAPVIAQVAESSISDRLGIAPVAATYRLLERAGHTTGPMIVGQIALLSGSGTIALGWIGGLLIALGMIFAVSVQTNRGSPVTAKLYDWSKTQ